MTDRLEIQGIYRHFKGNLYQVKCLAADSETGEQLVVYQALYGDFGFYVRPLDMFLSKVDKEKYPDAGQEYRFELCRKNEKGVFVGADDVSAAKKKQSTAAAKKSEKNYETEEKLNIFSINKTPEEDDAAQVDPDVLDFLDASNYEQRLEILGRMRYKITDDMLDIMSTVIDIEIPQGPIESRYERFREALEIRKRYETNRLRTF